jgi:hypothetical protein
MIRIVINKDLKVYRNLLWIKWGYLTNKFRHYWLKFNNFIKRGFILSKNNWVRYIQSKFIKNQVLGQIIQVDLCATVQKCLPIKKKIKICKLYKVSKVYLNHIVWFQREASQMRERKYLVKQLNLSFKTKCLQLKIFLNSFKQNIHNYGIPPSLVQLKLIWHIQSL